MTAFLGIGTKKGLFLARSDDDRATWQISGPHMEMSEVYGVAIDTRPERPRLHASSTMSHFGPTVMVSDDLGETWLEQDKAPVAFPESTGASLARVWQIQPGPASEPGVVWAGTEPSALFKSTDGGLTYEFVESLWNHPHREQWGAGFGGQAIHTVLPHPDEAGNVLVAMSTGGVYRTADGGQTWSASNTGIKAYFFPDPWPEFGQCVHKVARDAENSETYYAQNHHGVYRSDDAGATWQSIADGLPSDFGFPMVSHPHKPGVIFNFPLFADRRRFPVDYKCRVFRSTDAGKTWEALSDGLPQEPYYSVVLRDAMCADNAETAGVYFGTRGGDVFASRDEGDTWTQVAAHLPEVLSVRAAVLA
jgi:photosystem II stability/assembly factor-like uncharacterized protein